MLDVDHHHRALREVGIGGDEVARSVHAGAVVPGAGHEDERPLRTVLRLREMPRERDEHRQAVGVVAGAVEPRIDVRVEDDHFVAPAGDDRDGVLRLQVGPRFGLERQADAQLVGHARDRRAIHDRLEEMPVAAADVEARVAAVAEVARSLVARAA